MLAVLPVLALASLFVGLRLRAPSREWRRDLLRASLLWGAVAIWLTQILSAFFLVNRWGLALAWIAVCLAALAASGARQTANWPRIRPRLPEGWGGWDWAMAAPIGVIMAGTAVVARWSPPQTWDTLNYHMARVAHWAQMASVRPYATGIEIQNSMPPGGEMLYLQPYVLAAGDAWVNFVDWTAMWIAVLGASLLAKQLGGSRRAQLLSALFVAALPMGIVQAASTMTDMILALWLVGLAVEVLAVSKEGGDSSLPFLFIALGAGLAIVTKPTAFAYLLPFAVWTFYRLARRRPIARQLGVAVLGGALVLSVNWSYFSGNQRLYGNPLAPSSRISQHANPWLGGRAFVSNILRNVTYQLATPSPYVNKAIALSVITVHNWMGLNPSDPRITVAGRYKVSTPTTSEDVAQNPVQMYLLLAAGIYLLLRWRRGQGSPAGYALAVVSTFLAFSLIYQWQIFGGRFLVPFFALAAPVAGLAAERALGHRGVYALAALLAVTCVPWLVGVTSRPLIARDDSGHLWSILSAQRTDLYFSNGPYLEKPYLDMTQQITGAGCRSVGLMLSGGQAEYPIWALLGDPGAGVDIEWIVAGTPSAALASPAFAPCAIIRESTDPMPEQMNALPFVYKYGAFGLYLEASTQSAPE